MKKIDWFFIALIFALLTASSAKADEPSPMVKLNRLSRMLRGIAPDPQEREQMLAAQRQNRGELYLNRKITEYLNSEEYVNRMNVRLDELFRVETLRRPLSGEEVDKRPSIYVRANALDHLFRDVVRYNRSFDQLLVGKEYRLFQSTRVDRTGLSDDQFMSSLVPDFYDRLAPTSVGESLGDETDGHPLTRDVRFSEKDPRIAGAITTSRFFSRYTTTGRCYFSDLLM